MYLLDLTLPTPAENLALDEALLLALEAGGSAETLRFWESPVYFVVLGYSGRAGDEIYLDRCRREGVPVLRRMTGGGTVLLGPGCLNYSLLLNIAARKTTAAIPQANAWIMDRQRKALSKIEPGLQVDGTTDLAFKGRKLSGNAQRRLKKALLFHGTFLYDFRLDNLEKYLRLPVKQPPYRKSRGHGEFLTNVKAPPSKIKEALSLAWNVKGPAGVKILDSQVQKLVGEKYGNPGWNMKF